MAVSSRVSSEFDVVGDDLRHRDARLVQDDVSEPEAVADADPLHGQRIAHRDRRALEGDRLEFARRDHLGQQHRRRLQRLDLFLRIGAPRAVLDDQNADRRAVAQHGDAEERLIDLFARFGLVGEGRVVLRVGERERLGARRDQADEALARLHRRQMDGLAIQALGGEKLHGPVGAHDIERADFRHHVRGDQDDDAVEARLRGDGLRHDLAEPPQQQTGSAWGAHVRWILLFRRTTGRRCPPCNERASTGRKRPQGSLAAASTGVRAL